MFAPFPASCDVSVVYQELVYQEHYDPAAKAGTTRITGKVNDDGTVSIYVPGVTMPIIFGPGQELVIDTGVAPQTRSIPVYLSVYRLTKRPAIAA